MFDVEKGKEKSIKELYILKARREARINILKEEIRQIDKIIYEKQRE
jgi:hypothetical protein